MIEINRNPTERDLRWFGALQLIFFAIVGWGIHRRTGTSLLPGLILALSIAIAAVGVASPARLKQIYIGWMLAVYPIGWVVSRLLLATIFYLVVTPMGFLLRCLGRDPMQRQFDPAAKTYWISRPDPPPANQYFRQF